MQSIYDRTNQNSVMTSDTRKYGHVYWSKYYEYMTEVKFGTCTGTIVSFLRKVSIFANGRKDLHKISLLWKWG
jgi:hypothetical protein